MGRLNLIYSRLTKGISLLIQRLRLCFPMQRVQVWSSVRELRSRTPQGQKKKNPPNKQNIKQKQYCNKFNKDFKNGLHNKWSKKKSLKTLLLKKKQTLNCLRTHQYCQLWHTTGYGEWRADDRTGFFFFSTVIFIMYGFSQAMCGM